MVNAYRSEGKALLAPGRGFCRLVSFKDLGAKYELVSNGVSEGAGAGGDGRAGLLFDGLAALLVWCADPDLGRRLMGVLGPRLRACFGHAARGARRLADVSGLHAPPASAQAQRHLLPAHLSRGVAPVHIAALAHRRQPIRDAVDPLGPSRRAHRAANALAQSTPLPPPSESS